MAHLHDLGDDRILRPVDAKHLGELAQVDRRSLADGKDGVAEPPHAEVGKLLVEEGDAELLGEERDVLDDGLPNAPLLVFGELDDGGQKSLREELDADDVVDDLELRDDVESDFGELVLEKLEEEGEEVFDSRVVAEEGRETRDLARERGADVLGSVGREVADAGHDAVQDGVTVNELGEPCNHDVSTSTRRL